MGRITLDKEEKISNRKDKKQKRISEERRKWSESYWQWNKKSVYLLKDKKPGKAMDRAFKCNDNDMIMFIVK